MLCVKPLKPREQFKTTVKLTFNLILLLLAVVATDFATAQQLLCLLPYRFMPTKPLRHLHPRHPCLYRPPLPPLSIPY
jgi:hypothetical protein